MAPQREQNLYKQMLEQILLEQMLFEQMLLEQMLLEQMLLELKLCHHRKNYSRLSCSEFLRLMVPILGDSAYHHWMQIKCRFDKKI